jgi:multiple sugar transport system substrate-binding protein
MKALSNHFMTLSHPFLVACCLVVSQLHAQTVLTVAAYPAVDEIVKAALPDWQRKHPQVQVRVVSRDFADHHTAMTTALSASSGLPDVMTIEYGYLGRFANSGGFEDLSRPPYLADRLQPLFIPYAWTQAHSVHGQSAIPTDIGPGVMFYRADLLQMAGLQPNALIKDWPSFIQSGLTLKAKTGAHLVAHARDVKDLIIRTNLQGSEGIYFDQEKHSLVGTSPRFKLAFEVARDIRMRGLDARVLTWSNEWGESLRRGHVAVQMMGAWLGGHLQNWLAPQSAGLWRSGPLPGGVSVSWGGTFYAIPNRAAHKDLAWDLIQYLTTCAPQQQMAFERFNAFPALLSAQQGAYFEQEVPFLGGQKARTLWRDTAQKISAHPVFKNDAIAEELVNAQLDLVLTRGKSVDAALADAHKLVQMRASR